MPQSATSGLKIDARGAFGVFRGARTGKKKKKKNRTSIIEWIHFQKHPHIRLKRRSTQNNLKVSGNEERSQLILEGLKVPTPQREHLQIFIYYWKSTEVQIKSLLLQLKCVCFFFFCHLSVKILGYYLTIWLNDSKFHITTSNSLISFSKVLKLS